jgi:glycosyltransferase involved in cell wall biosynthesis
MADWYLPGHKSGGPVRTLASVVNGFGEHYDIRIITRDRDCGDKSPYSDLSRDCWTKVGKAQVCYASALSIRRVRRWMREADPDLIYLNSFFSKLSRMILLLRFLRLLPANRIILAPRGEFSPGALNLKTIRKRLYLLLCRKTHVLDGLLWQASSDLERQQIKSAAGAAAEIQVAGDLRSEIKFEPTYPRRTKCRGSARFIFLSRISPMKNLKQVLEFMTGISGSVELDIFGPVEDRKYWRNCRRAIARMPSSITVRYCGSVPPDEVMATIARYDFFVLPTLGENFGHAIFEALSAGRPVLISDQTQWRGLVSKNAGWDLALADKGAWKAALQACVEMDQIRYDQLSTWARKLARAWLSDTGHPEQTRALFDTALKCQSSLSIQ